MSELELVEALRAVGPGPCDRCAHRTRCAEHELACKDFFLWATGEAIRFEDRLPSRLWLRRVDDSDDEPVDGRWPAYWRGVKDACDHRGDRAAHTAAVESALAALESPAAREGYLDGLFDAEEHSVKRQYLWKRRNERPRAHERRERAVALGITELLNNNVRAETLSPPEQIALRVSQSREPVAVFREGPNSWSVHPARLQRVQNRIEDDTRAFVGVFGPDCPPEWVLQSLEEAA
jgi:hypothetical protein